jgi:NRAMP (natural resistance-associated macrophage protein)-like metal ion transporter
MSSKRRNTRNNAEAPAEILARRVAVAKKISAVLPTAKVIQKTGDYWNMLGPGLTTGASDDDPSGIATYSQTGAQYGFQLLWMSAWTFPLMAVIQEMCARIGLVTGRGLAGNIRVFFPKRVLYACTLLLFAANALNIGADIGAMAKAIQLLDKQLNFSSLVVGITIISIIMQIFTPYAHYARYLKWLALVLFSYVFSALLAHLQWHVVLENSFLPRITFSKNQILLICAILGTTISPYLFFWQTSQEVEVQILKGKTTLAERKVATAPGEIKSMRIDVWSGMILSNIVMFFIISACASILFKHGIVNINSTAQAAEALRPFAGNSTYFLFAIGIIGTGLLAIPVMAGSSSYALAESFHWREGLHNKFSEAYAFYGVIIVSMLIGLALNFVGIDPIKALIYAAVGNGLVAPIILLCIVIISSNHRIMGRWTNKPSTTAIGWFVVAIMSLSGIAAIVTLF